MTHRSDLVASDAVAVTASDTTPAGYVGIYIGTTGNVAIKGKSGVAVTLKNVPSGTIIPLAITAVMSTNTTATDIVGFVP